MYAIFKDNKRYGTKKFTNYEEARSWARKLIRQGKFTTDAIDHGNLFYKNPSISLYNLSIKAV